MRKPKYRRHSTRGFPFVEIRGKRIRLPGEYDSPESWIAYNELWARMLRQKLANEPIEPVLPGDEISIAEVCRRYVLYAESYYTAGRGKRNERQVIEAAASHLAGFCGLDNAATFGPKKLKAFRDRLKSTVAKTRAKATAKTTADNPASQAGQPAATAVQRTLSVGYINSLIARVKRMFKWAVSEEILPPSSYHALATVPGLRVDASDVRVTARRRPVDLAHVVPVLRHVSPVIRSMIRVQVYTGVRSGSLVRAQPDQFDTSVTPWLWRPRHKNERRKPLVIPIGPRCRRVLARWIAACEPGGYLFPPDAARKDRRHRKLYASQSYLTAISRGIDRANAACGKDGRVIPHWTPHQLRHALGHAVREKYGIEAAQSMLGHDSLEATEIYSDRRLGIAKTIAEEIG